MSSFLKIITKKKSLSLDLFVDQKRKPMRAFTDPKDFFFLNKSNFVDSENQLRNTPK